MKVVHFYVAAGLAFASLGWGQQAPLAAAELSQVRLSREVQPILDANCVQCHALEIRQAELVLEEGVSYEMLVGQPSTQSPLMRVKPGVPEESYLLLKLKGVHQDAGGLGLGMPLTEGVYVPLSENALATIEAWIGAGAPDN